MPNEMPPNEADREAFWRDFLTHGDPKERRIRGLFKRIPASPRCKLCAAPFAGPGAPLMRALGKQQSFKNPTICETCFLFMRANHGGAEIDGSFLFADIRGSTPLAEGMSAGEFSRLLDRFYATASAVVFEHDGMVDKFVGDEVVAMFLPLLTGDQHAAKAVAAAKALLVATGHREATGPWAPIGAGVHTGTAWVGAVGDQTHVELTALGDTVNTTARLAAAASGGEVLVSIEAAMAAGVDITPAGGYERRALELRGKAAPTEVVVIPVGRAARHAAPAGA